VTATKFKPFIFSELDLAFSYVSKICTIMILYDFCLLPAYFCYIIFNVREVAGRRSLLAADSQSVSQSFIQSVSQSVSQSWFRGFPGPMTRFML
jgi:hypothetical protein